MQVLTGAALDPAPGGAPPGLATGGAPPSLRGAAGAAGRLLLTMPMGMSSSDESSALVAQAPPLGSPPSLGAQSLVLWFLGSPPSSLTTSTAPLT